MTKRKKIIFYATVILIGLMFLDKFAYRPTRGIFIELKEKISVEEKKAKSNIQNLAQRKSILEEYKKFSDYVNPIETDEREMTKFLNITEEASRNSRIYVTDIKPQPVIELDFYKKYIIELDAELEIEQVMDFIHRLESLNQLINVERLQLSREKEGSRIIKAHITVTKILVP